MAACSPPPTISKCVLKFSGSHFPKHEGPVTVLSSAKLQVVVFSQTLFLLLASLKTLESSSLLLLPCSRVANGVLQ